MGLFVISYGMKYLLLEVYYVLKSIELVVLPHKEDQSTTMFLKKNILSQFGTPYAIISNGGSYICNCQFKFLLKKHGIKYRLLSPIMRSSPCW